MRAPRDVNPHWDEEAFGDFVTAASASIEMGPPCANPQVAGITLYLGVRESDEQQEEGKEGEGDYSTSFSWRVSTDAEVAGFGDEELDSGESPNLERAKRDCWAAVIDYLRSDTYTDEEIVSAAGC